MIAQTVPWLGVRVVRALGGRFIEPREGNMESVSLQDWIDAHPEDKELRYGRAGIDQAVFIRDWMARAVSKTYEQFRDCATVIGEHTSKSVRLPVVLLARPGLSVVVRDNFHNWAVSVKRDSENCPERITVEAFIEDGGKEAVASVYCEGFPESWVFGCYADNPKQFTAHIGTKYDAYAFLRLIGLS